MNNVLLAARANIFKAVSLLYMLPDDDIAETVEFLEEAVAEALPEAIDDVLMLKKVLADQTFSIVELHKDFARLFVGPEKLIAPPYGSVYLDRKRQLMQESTLEALHSYIEAGLHIHENFDQPPDFISVEFEFAYFLTLKFIETGSNEHAIRLRDFLTGHLCRWIGDFGELVRAGAKLKFYPALTNIAVKIAQKEVIGYASANCAVSS